MKVKITELHPEDTFFGDYELPMVGDWEDDGREYVPGWRAGNFINTEPVKSLPDGELIPENETWCVYACKLEVIEE